MNIEELLIAILLTYGTCGAVTLLLLLLANDVDTFEAHEVLIAWPIVLVALVIRTVKKTVRYIKE